MFFFVSAIDQQIFVSMFGNLARIQHPKTHRTIDLLYVYTVYMDLQF